MISTDCWSRWCAFFTWRWGNEKMHGTKHHDFCSLADNIAPGLQISFYSVERERERERGEMKKDNTVEVPS